MMTTWGGLPSRQAFRALRGLSRDLSLRKAKVEAWGDYAAFTNAAPQIGKKSFYSSLSFITAPSPAHPSSSHKTSR